MSTAPQELRVGFVGLGNMGAPMVRNLAKAGFALTVHDLDEAVQAAIAEEVGAKAALSPADFARTDVVVTMLPDDSDKPKAWRDLTDLLPTTALDDPAGASKF